MKAKPQLLFWLFSLGFFLLTRLINLKIIPIFTDEAIYTYWAQVALHDPANRFISLEDGKQPLFIWIAAIFQKFISDPLIATRIVSVFAGFGSLVGIYLLSKVLFNAKVAKLSSFLYIVLPFTMLYDRMALFDSLLTMFGIWTIFFSVKLAQDPKLDIAILNGFTIGLGVITKSSANFFLYFLPFSLAFFNFKAKNLKIKFFKWLSFATVATFIAETIYNALRLSPLFYIISRKNLEFIRSFSEVVADPFANFYSNISSIVFWIAAYIGWPLVLLAAVGLIYGLFKRNLAVVYLSILIFVPVLAEAFFNKVLYPRFALFYFPYIIILISFATVSFFANLPKYKKFFITLFVLFLITPALSSFRLLTAPTYAKIADSDAGQYLNDWPAGNGVSQIVEFIKTRPQDNNIYVGTEGTFGLLPYALQIHFYGQENIRLLGFWPVDENNLPRQILDLAQKGKTYFVFNENQREIKNPHLKFLAKYQKGKGTSFMRLYEVVPQ
ncbi:hypothetical protein A2697_01565 [Candidatus Curtissbacteria bacterium RIFCSPHIGHO2_01_FULL_41_44]|uniref:Glycosyltransferase RgtA/B/C/D-like domain-containing protein n=1 Tax=Candidatus Curtissbacteria bacterium RIFCSPLOWO2_01_FULL_42_50 TaxID=1797730 RepID=A0A1F5H6B9_9BACT|nr:MAG: hypothetical protein A2697_01565 [Candidatus Curtissbacteria bacterium RIFCSPHIGHO2_01_FULL_41_44]OGD99618.1 MAG: hypothetical protein A3B54_02940 [Candidatus Curtissbacteria bacterium RIFCSPLOWO2_01_FULL_42_50]